MIYTPYLANNSIWKLLKLLVKKNVKVKKSLSFESFKKHLKIRNVNYMFLDA